MFNSGRDRIRIAIAVLATTLISYFSLSVNSLSLSNRPAKILFHRPILTASLENYLPRTTPSNIESNKELSFDSKIRCSQRATKSRSRLSMSSKDTSQFVIGEREEKFLKKALSWLILTGVCYVLQSFYGVITGTFFLSFIGNSVVETFQSIAEGVGRFFQRGNSNVDNNRKLPRKFFAALYIVLLGLGLTRFVLIVFPRVIKETQYFLQIVNSENPYRLASNAISQMFGDEAMMKVESVMLAVLGESGRKFAGYDNSIGDKTLRFGKLIQYSMKGYLQGCVQFVSKLITDSTAAAYKGALALIFSLMVVWDLPLLQKAAKSLEKSKLSFAYKELQPKLSAFGSLVGQSFEVQALIALLNCLLTTLGLMLLKIPSLGFFSLLTFVASFIPVAGIFIATLPPLVIAFTEGGVVKAGQLVAMVIGVHAVESYMLYPQIYALKLKMHPLLVLSALAIAEHFAGIQGLFLAIPITLYIITHLIFEPQKIKTDKQQSSQ